MAMAGRPVGVTMDQPRAGIFPECFGNGFLIDIHSHHGLAALGDATLIEHLAGHESAFGQRPGQHGLLPDWVAYLAAELLIGQIVTTQAIAMHEQGRGAMEVDQGGFGQKACATSLTEALAKQKIPVAVHDEDGQPGIGLSAQSLTDCARQRRGQVVVAYPGFEQVAQNVKLAGLAGRTSKKGKKTLQGRRVIRRKVQIGYE